MQQLSPRGLAPKVYATVTYARLELVVDGSQDQEPYEYTAQVYLAEESVGRSPCMARPLNAGPKYHLSRRNTSFKIPSGINPVEETDRVEGLAAEMPRVGPTLDGHMLYTIVMGALPAEDEVEARNLAYRGSIGRQEII